MESPVSPLRRSVTSADVLDEVAGGGALPDDVANYFITVLRLRVGQRVELADGEGRILEGTLRGRGREWHLSDVVDLRETSDIPAITLLVGLIKAPRWKIVVEKAVELGVRHLVPVVTERSVPRRRGDTARFLDRAERIVRAAAAQSRRPEMTTVSEPTDLSAAIAAVTAENRVVAAIGSPPDGWESLKPLSPTCLLVGPEGGLTSAELAFARSNGFRTVALGAYTLRSETAAVSLIAMARDRLRFNDEELGSAPWS
jgi:16S rRNA (uracil1498-N3)-methyltransferase